MRFATVVELRAADESGCRQTVGNCFVMRAITLFFAVSSV